MEYSIRPLFRFGTNERPRRRMWARFLSACFSGQTWESADSDMQKEENAKHRWCIRHVWECSVTSHLVERKKTNYIYHFTTVVAHLQYVLLLFNSTFMLYPRRLWPISGYSKIINSACAHPIKWEKASHIPPHRNIQHLSYGHNTNCFQVSCCPACAVHGIQSLYVPP